MNACVAFVLSLAALAASTWAGISPEMRSCLEHFQAEERSSGQTPCEDVFSREDSVAQLRSTLLAVRSGELDVESDGVVAYLGSIGEWIVAHRGSTTAEVAEGELRRALCSENPADVTQGLMMVSRSIPSRLVLDVFRALRSEDRSRWALVAARRLPLDDGELRRRVRELVETTANARLAAELAGRLGCGSTEVPLDTCVDIFARMLASGHGEIFGTLHLQIARTGSRAEISALIRHIETFGVFAGVIREIPDAALARELLETQRSRYAREVRLGMFDALARECSSRMELAP